MKRVILLVTLGVLLSLAIIVVTPLTDSVKTLLASILSRGEYLLNLVNKGNTLERYAPSDLVELSTLGAPGKYLRQEAAEAARVLFEDANRNGIELKILSAYRSYVRQRSLFSFYQRRSRDAHRFSAEAGHSEHQLGTTLDFGIGNARVDLTAAFADTPSGGWLALHGWEYGFVESYPRGKEAVTGYIYEPWHYRFIGKEAAKEWKTSGLTLGEFLRARSQYYDDE